jgi:hypothetical protein
VAFSDQANLVLDEVAENSMRAMLLRYVAQTADQLAAAQDDSPILQSGPVKRGSDEYIAPMLATSWNQCHPYNLYTPAVTGGTEYYGYRAPTGCNPTAFAQVLMFHRWPLHGEGTTQFSDGQGVTRGTHTADFSDAYDWGSMQPSYSAFGSNPPAAMAAVAELSYELGVAAAADFENGGTSSSTTDLGEMLGRFLYYGTTVSHFTQASLLPALLQDLRAGYPAIVSIPGHAVVADGLLVSGGATTYHINYGWGGTNNGWWAANAIPGGALDGGVTSIKPSLMAFPVSTSPSVEAGKPGELQWMLPKRREQEATKLRLYARRSQSQPWTSDASTLGRGASSGWSVVPAGKVGSGWFAGPAGLATLDLDETFVPDASTSLRFWQRNRLGSAAFTVAVSTNQGASFTPLLSRTNNYSLTWVQETISLAAYAGQTIRLRFELSSGSYYPDGGVWVDELAMTSGTWSGWSPLSEALTLGSRRFSSVITPWAAASDFSQFQKTSTSSYKDWVVAPLDNGGTGFYKEPGGYGNAQYHLTSIATLTPAANTRLRIRAKYDLASDLFRLLVSTNRTTFTPIASWGGSTDWTDLTADLSAYAGVPVYLRLEYMIDSFIPGGGVWVDSISTELVTHPELEEQPLHFVSVDSIPAGTYETAAALIDSSQVEHRMSPTFTLTVLPGATHQVTFQLGDHGSIGAGAALVQTVPHGGAATAPTVIPQAGWTLTGWNVGFNPVLADLTVTAIYQAKLAAGGTPHWWLIENGNVAGNATDAAFNVAELSDPFGRGRSLQAEFVFGTNPKNPSTSLRVGVTRLGDGRVSLAWNGKAGRLYRVMRSSAMGAPWSELASVPCATDNLPLTWIDPAPPAGAAYYRLAVSVP